MTDGSSTAVGRARGPLVTVTSADDPRLDDYRDLNDPAGRRRLESARSIIVVEGRLAVAQLLASGLEVRSLLVDDRQVTSSAGLVEATRDLGGTVLVGTPDVVAGTVGFALHRGVVAVAGRPQPADVRVALRAARRTGSADGGYPVVAVLEGLNDHENIGSLFRNAAAFAVGAVLLDPTCADPFYRRSIRVSVGHVLHVPFARVSPWPDGLDLVREEGFAIVAMTPRQPSGPPGAGQRRAPDHVVLSHLRSRLAGDPPSGVALVFGAEGPGLSEEAVLASDLTVSIPMAGAVDSLNVATAAAVAFHALRPD